MPRPAQISTVRLAAAVSLAACVAVSAPAAAAEPPAIRSGASNPVPACVTPDQLMRFLKTRNSALDPRFKDIAVHYKRHGETWRVRWDYAFFQMAIETNFLTYRAPSGRMGDVDPSQFNFAGIGTTGGGVPGDRFPDVSTGVLGQIQHLVVYSGERITQPVAPRTRLKQDDILALSAPIAAKRPVTFQDLAGRWAVDKAYGRSIEWVADRFRSQFCARVTPTAGSIPAGEAAPGPIPIAVPPPVRRPAVPQRTGQRAALPAAGFEVTGKSGLQGPDGAAPSRATAARPRVEETDIGIGVAPLPAPIYEGPGAEIARRSIAEQRSTENLPNSRLGALSPQVPLERKTVSAETMAAAPRGCQIFTASYGGRRTALIRSEEADGPRLTLLTVLDGFEQSLTETFIRSLPPGATSLGVFDTPEAAEALAEKECETATAR